MEIVQALTVVAPALRGNTAVDREIVCAIWELCRSARDWSRGPHEPMFHGPRFIPAAEKKTLDQWIDAFESITLRLLRGQEEWLAFIGVPWLVAQHRLASRAAFLVPLYTEMLRQLHEDESASGTFMSDDGEVICESLGEMGAAAQLSIPLLRRVRAGTQFELLRSAAAKALTALA